MVGLHWVTRWGLHRHNIFLQTTIILLCLQGLEHSVLQILQSCNVSSTPALFFVSSSECYSYLECTDFHSIYMLFSIALFTLYLWTASRCIDCTCSSSRVPLIKSLGMFWCVLNIGYLSQHAQPVSELCSTLIPSVYLLKHSCGSWVGVTYHGGRVVNTCTVAMTFLLWW
jgi:hypothetical protein